MALSAATIVPAFLVLWTIRTCVVRLFAVLTIREVVESIYVFQLVDRLLWFAIGAGAVTVIVILPWAMATASGIDLGRRVLLVFGIESAVFAAEEAFLVATDIALGSSWVVIGGVVGVFVVTAALFVVRWRIRPRGNKGLYQEDA